MFTDAQMAEFGRRMEAYKTDAGRDEYQRQAYVRAMHGDLAFRAHCLRVIEDDVSARNWLVGEGSYDSLLAEFG